MKDQQPTLILISPGFAKDENDTTCLPAQQALVLALNKNYPDLSIIILALEYPFSKTTYQWKGNTVISFNAWKKSSVKKLFIARSVWKTLDKIKREQNVIGVLSFWCTHCAFLGKRFAKKNNIKHYSWILGQDAKKGNKYIKWIKPKQHELIALSDFVAREFYKNYHVMPSNIIPYGIDPAEYLESNYTRDIDVAATGSLIPLKQYDLFISLIFQLKKKFPNIRAVLCGKGPEEKKLKHLIAEYELENHILLAGEVPHDEVLKIMQRTKIFLHPSSYEGFGGVCIEALAAGAHVISFCKPMDEEIIYWHIVKNENEMLQATIDILQDNSTEHFSVIPYTVDGCVETIMQLFSYDKKNISTPAELYAHNY